MHAKKSILYNKGEVWSKATADQLYDVTMGSYNGAETCEFVGTFLLYHVTSKHGPNFGLYRDDSLGVLKSLARTIEATKKDICNIFKQYGLRITIDPEPV